MVIHYLQCGVKPAILPSLQAVYPSRFDSALDVRLLDITFPLETPYNNMKQNLMPLSELLIGFFQYYAHQFE
jgi:poly(A) RNA polymerase GLD2